MVDKKMQEVIDSGVDKDSQQLRIAVFTCLEIAGELFLYKKKNLGLGCEWEHIEKSRIKSIIFDNA